MSKTPKTRPKTYSTPEAAKLIGVSVITLHRWLAPKKIQPYGIELDTGARCGDGMRETLPKGVI
jgi:transposase